MNADNDHIQSVSSLTSKIKGTLEANYSFVWVRGQVANLSRPASGHIYFSLKDDYASLPAVWFKGSHSKNDHFDPLTGEVLESIDKEPLASTLANGQEVICAGKLTVYGARGTYQLLVEVAQDVGIGKLHAEFERIKKKLDSLGFFSAERKRVLPKIPSRIALITSPSGAAIHDFLTIAETRGTGAQIRLYPVKVQGSGAAEEIIQQIATIEKEQWAEVIVLIRGGGSLEDLWQFNEEALAIAVKNSTIPILAGIGHEVDVTLTDMTADVRAATPSHAAQLLWPERAELYTTIFQANERLEECIYAKLNEQSQRIDDALRYLEAFSPSKRLIMWESELKGAMSRIDFAFEKKISYYTEKIQNTYQGLASFSLQLQTKQAKVQSLLQRLEVQEERWVKDIQYKVGLVEAKLSALDPLRPLSHGFALVYTEESHVVKSIHDVSLGSTISIKLKDGSIIAVSQSKKKNKK